MAPGKVESAKLEASTLPQLNINKLDLQWVQVHCFVFYVCNNP